MHIDKLYFTLPEVLERWRISETDLVYLAENDKLRLSVRVFGEPVEFGDYEEGQDGERFRVPWEQKPFSGLLDLHACDVFQLFRCGELHVSEFRTPRADYASLYGDAKPVFVMIGDLLLRREERDRFELQSGFSSGGSAMEESTFIASADYQEVRCNGFRFRLGPRSRRKSSAPCTRPRRGASPGRAARPSCPRQARRACAWRTSSSRRRTGGS